MIPIWKKADERDAVLAAAEGVVAAARVAGLRAQLDSREQRTPGWKYSHYEMRGVPVRVEVGPRDVASGTCVVARRDVAGKEGKQMGVSLEPAALGAHLTELLASVQAGAAPPRP